MNEMKPYERNSMEMLTCTKNKYVEVVFQVVNSIGGKWCALVNQGCYNTSHAPHNKFHKSTNTLGFVATN